MFSIQPFDREGRMHQNQCIKSILGSLIQQGEPESLHSEGRSVRAVSVILPHWVWRKACMNMWTMLPWIHCWDSSMITVAFMCTAVVRNSEFKTKARFLNYTNTFKFHNELNTWCWKVWKRSLNAKLRLSFVLNSKTCHFYHGKEDCLKWFHLKKQGPSKKQNILDYLCNNRVTSW